jgi:hypothetical protein
MPSMTTHGEVANGSKGARYAREFYTTVKTVYIA